MRIVIAGVSGSGKTTVGKLLAERLGCEFADADTFHPPENIAKMSAGIPLADNDRAGWLDAMGDYLAEREDLVLACSALKRIYRDKLRAKAGDLKFIVLTASEAILRERMAGREHFMPASLLDSQLAALELGEDVEVLENAGIPSATVDRLVSLLLHGFR